MKPVAVPLTPVDPGAKGNVHGEEEFANDPRGNGVDPAGFDGMENGLGDGPRRFGLAVVLGTEVGGIGKGEKEGKGKANGDEPGGRGESTFMICGILN